MWESSYLTRQAAWSGNGHGGGHVIGHVTGLFMFTICCSCYNASCQSLILEGRVLSLYP